MLEQTVTDVRPLTEEAWDDVLDDSLCCPRDAVATLVATYQSDGIYATYCPECRKPTGHRIRLV